MAEKLKKAFIGVRLKRLREEKHLTQQALADALGISLSYLNQIENNHRPVTMRVLLKLESTFGSGARMITDSDEARLVSELREALADPALGEPVALADLRELAANMPALARAVVAQSQRLKHSADALAIYSTLLGDAGRNPVAAPSTPFEEVRDFFYARHNHIDELDRAAETVARDLGLPTERQAAAIARRLETRHGVTLADLPDEEATTTHRSFDARRRILRLSRRLHPGQSAFQMATQLAFLEQSDAIDALAPQSSFSSKEARALARIGLANYFAGALILPYGPFLQQAERLSYDIDLLGHEFGMGFETICHRLSTLQRPEARGVPFFFIRVDRAGNISKRQSATDFHFSRVGGTCPLWNVYDAFSSPGRTLTQVAEMPDGRAYLWIARTVESSRGGYRAPVKRFAIGLGCDLLHADRLVYSRGLDLQDRARRTLIGAGCKVCERPGCAQRALPPLARTLIIDDARSSFSPYPAA